MRKTIVAFAGVAVLASWGPAMAADQGLSPEAQLCKAKKDGLASLEAEAPQIRVELAQKEPELETARTENDKWDNLSLGEEAGAVPEWLQTSAKFAGMNPRAYIRREHTKWADKLGKLRDKVTELQRRQTEVGSQIFLLRDIIAGLKCHTLTPAPPVDYGAIDQHTQQYQQSQPGSQTTTSGQSVQPQGSYAAPSSGFGASSGSTQPAGQQGQQPGYGPGPDESGSPRVPYDQIKVEGSIGEKPGMSKPGGG
jgi:hypothetical protein